VARTNVKRHVTSLIQLVDGITWWVIFVFWGRHWSVKNSTTLSGNLHIYSTSTIRVLSTLPNLIDFLNPLHFYLTKVILGMVSPVNVCIPISPFHCSEYRCPMLLYKMPCVHLGDTRS